MNNVPTNIPTYFGHACGLELSSESGLYVCPLVGTKHCQKCVANDLIGTPLVVIDLSKLEDGKSEKNRPISPENL